MLQELMLKTLAQGEYLLLSNTSQNEQLQFVLKMGRRIIFKIILAF